MGWDADLLIFLQENVRNDFLDIVMKLITHTGDKGILMIAIIAALLIIPKTRSIGIMTAMSLAIEAILNNVILKNLVARTRPYEAIEGLVNIIEKQKDFSFPSGHTGSTFAVSGVILVIALFGMPIIAKEGNLIREKSSLAMRIIAVVFTIYSVLLGFSRLYVGVHYPTDVLAGLALGLITSAIAYLVYQLILKKIANKKALSSKE